MSVERTIKPNEPADFTPQMGNYKTLQPFRYWCQKVLPLVYDDSLSYYELLCKVVDYLNKTMEDVETLNGDVTNLHQAYDELQGYVNNYFSTLDVQEEINNKLDELVESGRIDALLNAYIPYVTPQMFGAKGDGISDDTEAFQHCFNSNKKIIVPIGTYNVGECVTNYDCDITLHVNADIKIKGRYFLRTNKQLTISGGRFYGEPKAPESRYYAKVAITGTLTMININETRFYQCIALKQTSDNNYCGFINCTNMWVYDSLFIVANKSLNYVTLIGCVLQHSSNMIEATNFENISLIGCSIESVTNLFSPTYTSAPYNGITINGCYIEYSSLFLNGKCSNIVIRNSWIYTNVTLVTLNEGPGNITICDNIITLLDNTLLTNVTNISLLLSFGVGSIKQNNMTINRTNVKKIYSGNCIPDIRNIDERYMSLTSDFIRFTGDFNYNMKYALTVSKETNMLYFNSGISNLKAATQIPIMLDLGRSDLLQITPPVGCLAIEKQSRIMYSFDGVNWRNCGDGSVLT